MGKIDELIKQFCPNGVEVVELGKIAKLVRGKVISKKYVLDNNGEYPVYSSQTSNNGEFGRINTYMFDGDYVTWTTDGAYAGTVFRRTGKFNITNICGLIKLEVSSINVGFLYYWLAITAKKYVNRATDNPKLMSNVVATIKVPLPPLAVQKEIVEILDTFTGMIDNLQKELKQRQKQFEYYKEKWLTFEEGKATVMKVGDLFDFKNGLNKEKSAFGQGTSIVNYTDVYKHRGLKKIDLAGLVTLSDKEIERYRCLKGDVFFTRTSETKEEVGCPSVLLEDIENCTFSGFVLRARPKTSKLLPEYCKYCFFTYSFTIKNQPL